MLQDLESHQEAAGKTRWKHCLQLVAAHIFSDVGICGLAMSYAMLGALVFEALETRHELAEREHVRQHRTDCMRDLWRITNELNVLYEANWTLAVGGRLREFEETLVNAVRNEGYDGRELDALELQWSFPGALLYSITVITTIGYGNISPKTSFGKVLTVFYATVGIPLMFLCLLNAGHLFARIFKFGYFHVLCVQCRQRARIGQVRDGMRVLLYKYFPGNSSVVRNQQQTVDETLEPSATGQHLNDQDKRQATESDRLCTDNEDPGVTDNLITTPSENEKSTTAQSVVSSRNSDSSQHELVEADDFALEESQSSRTDSSEVSIESRLHNFNSSSIPPSFSNLDVAVPNKEDNPRPKDEERVPLYVVMLFITGYVFVGAVTFSVGENWNFIDAVYFCITALSTIGFGNLVPGSYDFNTRAHSSQTRIIICCFYLILGLAIVLMAYNLVREEIMLKFKRISRNFKIMLQNEKP
ncbi:potassium channel subfamily K member 18-like [Tachypleus tridentatus]|uniref:potassium channel subfamily K member 18-like n=1 Tax=Tachypleus tridentatus TaxID=6853 RepID=UPI003FD52701